MLRPHGTPGTPDASSLLGARMSDNFDDFGVIPLGPHGGYRKNAGRPRKGSPPREKTSASLKSTPDRSRHYLRRLLRDANDGCKDAAILLQGILDGRITEYAAACEMSYCRRREPTGRGSENMTRRNDWAMHKLLNPKSSLGVRKW